jgi:quinate dehydrogenase (quinone)
VNQLQVAWTYRTGRRTTGSGTGVDENPAADRHLAVLVHAGKPVTAIDADTGKAIWKFDPRRAPPST